MERNVSPNSGRTSPPCSDLVSVPLTDDRKAECPFMAETEQVVERFLSRPEEYEADTCGPGPFSLGNPETTRGILEAAGFDEIELHQRDFDYFMGADMDEAIDSLLAIGPGAELIVRLANQIVIDLSGPSPQTSISNLTLTVLCSARA